MRDDAPFTAEQWSTIDETIIDVASKRLVGRKVINLYGPLGGAHQSIELDTINVEGEAHIDKWGNEEEGIIEISERKYIPIPLIYKDFLLSWRDLETSKNFGRPLDLSLFAASAASLASKEDNIIFNGTKDAEGVMNATGRLVIEKGNWDQGDTPYTDVAKAIEILIKNNSYQPYGLVVSSDLYIKMQRIQDGTGVTVLSRVKELVDGRVYQSPTIEQGKAVVLSIGRQNMDIVVGQDMVTAYLGDEQLNHLFRVMETIALRIKRPQSICTIE